VYLSANVVELEGGGTGPVSTARVRTLTGSEFRVDARAFVLAAGGIENPRLLLASQAARPAGLGNEHDLVGRHFMEHLHVRLGCFVPERGDTNLNLYIEGRRSVRRPLGALTVGRAERHAQRLFGFSAAFFPPTRRSIPQVLRYQARLRHPWGLHAASIARGGGLGFGLRVMDKAVRDARETGALSWHGVPVGPGRRVYEIMGRGEQTPLRDSRVILSRDRDRLGMPVAMLDWRVNPCDLASITTSLRVIGGALRDAGIGRIHLPQDPDALWADRITGSWHHMGTTRMDVNPRFGVVDRDGRVHSVPNVYIAGSSVFPTGGYANPTLTLLALALRLADHLERQLTASIPLSLGRRGSREPQSVSAD
jgi:choline dehydrogenase-like flavoprotein